MEEKNLPKNFGNKKDFAKNLGRIKAANLMIVGRLTNFDNEFRIIFTILETKEGSTISGAKGKITASELLKSKNKDLSSSSAITVAETSSQVSPESGTSKREGDRTIHINDSIDMDLDCSSKKIGSILIDNRSKYKLSFQFAGKDPYGFSFDIDAIADKQESTPVMGIIEGTYGYSCSAYDDKGSMILPSPYLSGTITVIKCKEVTIRTK